MPHTALQLARSHRRRSPRGHATDDRDAALPRPQQAMLDLQGRIGNRAVQRLVADGRDGALLQRACACGGSCEKCASNTVQREGEGDSWLPSLPSLPALPDLPSLPGLPGLPSLPDLPSIPSLDELIERFMNQPPVWDPADYCTPFSSPLEAQAARIAMRGPFLLAIAVKFRHPEALRLWTLYIDGGSPLQRYRPPSAVSQEFGASQTTASVTQQLLAEAANRVQASPPAFAGGAESETIPIADLLDPSWIDNPVGGMDFNQPTELPGNIAGGIGKDQLTTVVGAQPSPQNDSREVTGSVTVRKNPDGTLAVTAGFRFSAGDTIDFCPGNMGANLEQNLTIPLSRLEASGVAGDVPFVVEFDGPASSVDVTPNPPTPQSEGTVTASRLNIREGPGRVHAVLGQYPSGSTIRILETAAGDSVHGESRWYRTDRGWVSAKYVRVNP